MIEVIQGVGGKDHHHMADDKKKEVAEDEEVERARDLAIEESSGQVKFGGDGGGLHYSGDEGEGGRDKDGGKVGEKLKSVVLEPATGWGKIEGEILDGGGDGMGDDVKGDWDNPSPLACGEKQNINGDSVGQPKRIENKVPPAGEADGVTNSW